MNFDNNFIYNIFKREIGWLNGLTFSSIYQTNKLNELELNKYRSFESSNSSLTWFSLETIDYKYLLVGKSDGTLSCIDLFNRNSNNAHKSLFKTNSRDGHKFSISCIQWYPFDNGMFFTSGMDRVFKIWDTNTIKPVDVYTFDKKIYSHHISSIVSQNTANLIAVALDDGTIKFIDMNSGSSTHTIKAHTPYSCVNVQWSPVDENIFASAGVDGRLYLFDVRSSKSLLKSFDQNQICDKKSKNSNSLKKFDTKATAHNGQILSLTFTQNGNHLITLGKDNRLRLWNVLSGTNTFVNYGRVPLSTENSLNSHSSLNLNLVPEMCVQMSYTELLDKNYIFVPANSTLLMYNMFDGELVGSFKGHFDSINCALYHPILNEIYTGSRDKNILIWSPKVSKFSSMESDKTTKRKSDGFSRVTKKVCTGVSTHTTQELDNWSDDD